ncbi:MAG: OmpA family protein [Planctomycetes bacterium]|nr:OmpA family protein [Planctomycetota bacterium]
MRVLNLVALILLAALLVPWTGGCCDEVQKNLQTARIMNADLRNQLTDKTAEVRELQERIRSLEARINDFGSLSGSKDDQIATLQNEVATLRASLAQKDKDLRDLIEKLGQQPVASGQLPEKTLIELRALQQAYPEFFIFDEAKQQLQFASDITFDSGQDIVKAKAQEVLTKLAAILNQDEAKPIRIAIIGHTDNAKVVKPETVRLHRDNQGLSEHRAEAVAKILSAGGVDMTRIATSGMGDSSPIASNNTADGKAKNRRVEIFLRMGM